MDSGVPGGLQALSKTARRSTPPPMAWSRLSPLSPTAPFSSDQFMLAPISEIHPNDDMLTAGEAWYFRYGRMAVDWIKMAASLIGTEQFANILDLPCGYGRVLRHLRACYPQARIVAAELNREAADFCARAFSAEPFYSNDDPGALILPGPFDLIWCGSLLTHLSADDSLAFLDLFYRSLASDGLLLFTIHGRAMRWHLEMRARHSPHLRPMLQALDRDGYAFRVRHGRYGGSYCSPQWALSAILRHDWRIVTISEAAWGRQDVIAVQKTAISALAVPPLPNEPDPS